MTQPDHSQRGHSALGASGAERWMNCAGSVALIARVRDLLDAMDIPEADDEDYKVEGTAQHECGEHCLREGSDTWEVVGQVFSTVTITPELACAVQVYLDHVRPFMDEATEYGIETQLQAPSVHPLMFGAADFWAYSKGHWLKFRDYKGGAGIAVDAPHNPQLMYYAFMVIFMLESRGDGCLPDALPVDLGIVQPRAFHVDGPIREWTTTVGEIKAWVHDELVPAMNRTAEEHDLDAGPWCRFCPAKLVCPMLTGLFKAACTADPKELVRFDNRQLALNYRYRQAVKFYLNALEAETFRRLNAGKSEGFEGVAKLVPKKSNRVWKTGWQTKARALGFEDKEIQEVSYKSPAEFEKTGAKAKEFVKENAYHPDTGLTVAPWDDAKPAVKVKTSQETFGAAVAALAGE